jgi:hypothetical protein
MQGSDVEEYTSIGGMDDCCRRLWMHYSRYRQQEPRQLRLRDERLAEQDNVTARPAAFGPLAIQSGHQALTCALEERPSSTIRHLRLFPKCTSPLLSAVHRASSKIVSQETIEEIPPGKELVEAAVKNSKL